MMKVAKVLNIIILFFTIFQVYNMEIDYRYNISDRKFNVEYYYEKGNLTPKEFNKEILEIQKAENNFKFYDMLNKCLLVVNGMFLVYWVYKDLKNDRREIKKNSRNGSHS